MTTPAVTALKIRNESYAPGARALVAEAWEDGNAEGRGFAPPSDDVEDGFGLGIAEAWSGSDHAVFDDGERIVIVADCNGPWAVEVPEGKGIEPRQ